MLKSCAAFVAAAGLVLTVACAQTDAGVSTNVKTKMAADDTVKAYQIDVDTRNGVVTLSGTVDNAAAKDQAVAIARGTDGVRDVVDQIRVGDPVATTGDNGFTDEVREEGSEAGDTAREIGRDTANAAERAADRAGDAASRAGGVVTDAAITSAVKAKFLADASVKGLKIDVDTTNGAVTLNGTVSSRAEADRAMMLARDTEGVTRVVDNLKVGRY
jgi:hyperosmotically inducible protein